MSALEPSAEASGHRVASESAEATSVRHCITEAEDDGLGAPEGGRSIGAPLSGGAWATERWRHGPVHADLPPLPDHVVAACYRGGPELVWRGDGRTVAGRLRTDGITIIPAGTEGRVDCDESLDTSHVYLPDARLQASANALGCEAPPELLLRIGAADARAAAILSLLAENAGAGDAYSRLFSEQCADLLCIQLIRAHSSMRITPEPPRRGLAPWQVRRVRDYARARLDQVVSLDELAAQTGLSRFHFCTAFRLATGRTPYDWLAGLRIQRAATLLDERELSITEIALQVGYGTPSAFSARFRRETGLTPTEFRRRLA